MTSNVRIILISCAAALLFGRASLGCAATGPSESSSGDSTSSGAGGAGSSSSSSGSGSSSSSGIVCDHCGTVEKSGNATKLCLASKALYDAVEACKCGMTCMASCMTSCKGGGSDSICTACLDAMCHNDLAACLGDQ